MEHKGYVTADGRVVGDRDRADLIAELGYIVTRYNLRRVFVRREWAVRPLPRGPVERGFARRRDAVAWALVHFTAEAAR